MLKNNIKYVAYIAITTVAIFTIIFYTSLNGNPVSKMLAKSTAQKHVENNYPECKITDVGYDCKGRFYYAKALDENNKDVYFSVHTSWTGEFIKDTYDTYVSSGYNTIERITREYEKLMSDCFLNAEKDYNISIFFGEIVTESMNSDMYMNKEHAMDDEDVITGKEYDVKKLSYSYGHIVLYVNDEEVSFERAAEILLDLKESLAKENIGFYSVDFVLDCAGDKNGVLDAERPTVRTQNFKYSDIYKENLCDRIKVAHEKLMAVYKQNAEEYGRYAVIEPAMAVLEPVG